MTTSLTALTSKVLQNLGFYKSGTLTTSSATVPADTALADNLDDAFNDWYLMPTAGTYVGVSRKLSDFTQSGGVMTPYTAFAGATGAVAYILTLVDPADILLKINQAVQELYPALWVPHIDEWSIITGNILPNAGFQDWALTTIPDKWNANGSTIAKNTTSSNIRRGASSVQQTGVSDIGMIIREIDNFYLRDLAGRYVTFKAWVKINGASKARLTMKNVGAVSVYGDYHEGDNVFRLLIVKDTIDTDTVAVRFGFYTADTTISYIDSARIILSGTRKYLLPTSFPTKDSVRKVYLQVAGNFGQSDDTGLAMCDAIGESVEWEELSMNTDWYIENDGTDKWLVFTSELPLERRIKIVGDKYPTVLSAQTDTIEFNAPQTNIIAAKATAQLFRAIAGNNANKDFKRYQEEADRWEGEAERLKVRYGIPRPSRMVW